MTLSLHHAWRGLVLSVAALAAPAWALDAKSLKLQSLVATCAQCHGTDGRAAAGEAMPKLAGQSKDHLLTQLLMFRDGKRPATVMHQIAKGYTPEQLEAMASYFAQQK